MLQIYMRECGKIKGISIYLKSYGELKSMADINIINFLNMTVSLMESTK
jgi:hypothetical protein